MININIIKHTVREVYSQAPIILVWLITLVILLVLIFSFNVEVKGEEIVSMRLIGISIDESEFETFGIGLLSDLYEFFKIVFMFLFIMQSSALFHSLLKNSLLGIILTRSVSRTKLIISVFLGETFAILLLLGTLTTGVVTILFFKTGLVFPLPFYICCLLFYEVVSMLALLMFLSLIIKDFLAISVSGVLIYFLLLPLLQNAHKMKIVIASYIKILFPYITELRYQFNNLIYNDPVAWNMLIYNLLYVILYTAFATYIFNKQDIG